MFKTLLLVSLSAVVTTGALANYEGEKGFYHTQRLRELSQNFDGQRNQVEKAKLLSTNYQKVTHYAHNIGLEILDQLERNTYPNGQQLNLINESLRSTIVISKEINRFKHNNNTLLKLHDLKMRVQVAEASKSLHGVYVGQKFLRDLVQDQMRWKQYGISDFEKEILASLTTQNIQVLESDIKNFVKNRDSYTNNTETRAIARELNALAIVQAVSNNTNIRYLSDTSVRWSATLDVIGMSLGKVTRLASQGFGTVAGNISWRQGYFYKNQKAFDHMKRNLRPLDLIYEKRGYVLTDKTIPGNWGHAGIWLGTKEELIELGLWDRPEFKFFRERIEAGEEIYEVRRWGLIFNNLKDWMNLDEAAIVRVSAMEKKSTEELLEVYKNLAAQSGKKYDFGFDAMTVNEITCMEIIALSYGNINWPMKAVAGRQTISPTDVAELVFYRNSPLEFITYIRGDKQGRLNELSLDTFGEVIDFENKGGHFEKRFRECHNEQYRINRSTGIRFRNVCKTRYEEMIYQELNLLDDLLK